MKPRDRLVLAVVALVGVMAALWLGVLAPKREQAAGLAAKITTAQERLDAANAKATKAEQARATYSRDYATVARLGKATPPQADVPSLVFQLESAARGSKVDFRSLVAQDQQPQAPASSSPSATTTPSTGAATTPSTGGAAASSSATGITAVPFTFTFEGTFHRLHELLRSVDRFSRLKGQTVRIRGRLLTLDAVTLSPGRDGFPQVKAEITARAYIAPIPGQLPAGATPAAPSSPNPSPATRVNP